MTDLDKILVTARKHGEALLREPTENRETAPRRRTA
jgi:hypothetical protein